MQNNKNGGRVRLKDIQNMLAKDFNIHKSNSCSWVFFYLG
jgi:hypothetical protein